MIVMSIITMSMLCCGCNRVPTAGAGLLVSNGVTSPRQVQYVVYQNSTWTTPQPQLIPLQRPYRVADVAAIEAFYNALNNPSGGLLPKTASNSRLGFIMKDGRVVIFAVGGAESESAKADLSAALKLAFATTKQQQYDTTTVPVGQVVSLSYTGKGRKPITLTSGNRFSYAERVWRELLSTYNPLSLRGNIHFTQQELRRFLAWVPEYVEVKVKKPVSYKAIVVPPDLDPKWPPSKGDNRSNLKTLEYDTVYVARLPETRSQYVRFVFCSSAIGDCLATDAVDPRAITGYAGKFGQATFGPNLFDEVVYEIKKP